VRFGILGTGMVGQALGTKLVQLGHEVRMGSRAAGTEAATKWTETTGERASEGTFTSAAAFGDVLLNCTQGASSLVALAMAGEVNMRGKVLIDVANPLQAQPGGPMTLAVCNTESLGEQLHRAFPSVRVVKALNTVNCEVMVAPQDVPGDHVVFVCGNDAAAKAQVTQILGEFGWPSERVLDLGDITAARGTEAYLLLWIRLMRSLGTVKFNLALVK